MNTRFCRLNRRECNREGDGMTEWMSKLAATTWGQAFDSKTFFFRVCISYGLHIKELWHCHRSHWRIAAAFNKYLWSFRLIIYDSTNENVEFSFGRLLDVLLLMEIWHHHHMDKEFGWTHDPLFSAQPSSGTQLEKNAATWCLLNQKYLWRGYVIMWSSRQVSIAS